MILYGNRVFPLDSNNHECLCLSIVGVMSKLLRLIHTCLHSYNKNYLSAYYVSGTGTTDKKAEFKRGIFLILRGQEIGKRQKERQEWDEIN